MSTRQLTYSDRKVLEDAAALKDAAVGYRRGVVTDDSPLTVSLAGGGAVPATPVPGYRPEVGDTVELLRAGNVLLAIGADHLSLEASTDVSFASGWANSGGALEEPRYFKDPAGIVHIEGSTTRATGFTFGGANSTIFTLGTGYRPEKTRDFLAAAFDGTRFYPANIRITSAGAVIVQAASARGSDGNAAVSTGPTQVALDGIHFRPNGV